MKATLLKVDRICWRKTMTIRTRTHLLLLTAAILLGNLPGWHTVCDHSGPVPRLIGAHAGGSANHHGQVPERFALLHP